MLFAPEVRQWMSLLAVLGFAVRAVIGQPALAQSVLVGETVNPIIVSAQKSVTPPKELKGPVKDVVVQPSDAAGVRLILTEVCHDRGYGDACIKNLLGMSWKESQFISTAVGDAGKARGYFQIHYKMHKVALSCAQDLRCSANWTITYLEWNHYKTSPKTAIQCHNGCGVNNGYAASAIRHGNRLWNETTELAMK